MRVSEVMDMNEKEIGKIRIGETVIVTGCG